MSRPTLPGAPCIGVLEGDTDFRGWLVVGLRNAGFRVVFSCGDIPAFYDHLDAEPCDIVILDPNVGGPGDGYMVATSLRARQSPIGIVMLTNRVALEDRLRGLEGGADVYLAKPVGMLELCSSLRSLARRMRPAPAPTSPLSDGPENAEWSLRERGWILASPEGISLLLSAQERVFMMALMDACGSVVRREFLAELLSPGDPGDFELHRIDVLVSRLRSKAKSNGAKIPLQSVRGQGYVFLG